MRNILDPRSAPDVMGSNAAVQDCDSDGVETGAVFLARNRQQRRVWAIREGRVHFFVRSPGGGTFWSPGHPPHLAPTVALFLAEVAGRLSPGAGRDASVDEGARSRSQAPVRPIPPHGNAYR